MRSFSKAIAIAACLSLSSAPFVDSIAGGGSSSGSSSPSSSGSSSGSSYSKPSSSGSSYSKPSSGSSSGSSHSTSPSKGSHSTPSTPSNNGYSKPGTTPAVTPHTTPATPNTTHSHPVAPAHGYNKPSTTTDTNAGSTPSRQPTTALGPASTKSMSAASLKAYQAERNSISKPPQPVHSSDIKNNPARSTYQNTDQYMNKRTTIVNNYNNTYPGWEAMGYGMNSNYGMWSNSFLTGMVMGYVGTNLASNSMWMYSHMREPWYPSYRADLEVQAANNAELKSKLAAMDAEIVNLNAKNAQPLQTNSIPESIDPALAIAPEVMMAADEQSGGMSWWFALLFFAVGLGAALFAIKLFK